MSLSKKDEDNCICERCPSYPNCAADDFLLLFCFSGKAGCKVDERGCTCPSCPVLDKYGLQNDYYCVNGSEKQLKKKG
jgi:hypothetical protein